ncbi:hypothetical protein QYE76_001894 [Lolium multiflorum]|uniref:Uncharacterized protein n=1 Tax=Lolium multiflorum TaxID=4521 RepID=A0AAD8RM75_LOLMU|nr:hypothetical protein QYE76_001894 [Lolium multiflorum]
MIKKSESSKLGDAPWFTPAYIKKTQASKLGDAQGIPFFIDNIIRFHVGAGIPGVAPHYISPPSTFNVLLGSSWMDPALAFRLVVRLDSSFTRDSKRCNGDQYMEDIAFGARFDDTDDEEKNENDDSLVLADYEGEDLPTIEWNREDPQLAEGTVFQTMMDCRNAITTYHILTKNNYEIKKNKEIHRCPPLGESQS